MLRGMAEPLPIADVPLERSGPLPLHAQIAHHFRSQIQGLFWPPNFKLKSEDHLARELGVARGTVRKAIQVLIEEGLLTQAQGKGTFVAGVGQFGDPSRSAALSGLLISNGEQLARTGVYFTDTLLSYAITSSGTPGDMFAESTAFRDVDVLNFTRLRSLREGPNSLIATEVSLAAVPGLKTLPPAALVSEPFHGLLRRRFGVQFTHAERVYSVETADAETAAHVDVEPGTPLLLHDQYSYDAAGRCIEHSRAWTRTDRHLQTIVIRGLS